jgi:hypothetical protein
MFGVFRVKNHDFTQNFLFFPILGGGARRVRPPLDPPLPYRNILLPVANKGML